MKIEDVRILAYNSKKVTSNYLVYVFPKKEYVVCSNLQINKGDIVWDWGHYFDDITDAVDYLNSDCISKID